MPSRNSRQLVCDTLNFVPTASVAKDIGSHRSTGISCFAYTKLISALGLQYRLPKIFDVGQMLAIVDQDVLDALQCDVVLVDVSSNGYYFTNAFEENNNWEFFDFGGRLEALVPKGRFSFAAQPDGSLVEEITGRKMVLESHVFDLESGGQPLDFSAQLPKLDLGAFRETFRKNYLLDDLETRRIVDYLRRVRESTDRAVNLSKSPFTSLLWAGGHAGIGVFPMLCYEDPAYVHKYHQIQTEVMLANLRKLLPKISSYVDIIDLGCGDWGTQNSLLMSPKMFKEFFVPYFSVLHREANRIAPHLKRMAHSCGAIYALLDIMIEDIGIQVINPVQWTTSGEDGYNQWKMKTNRRLALWGGGVNSQQTLPSKSVADIAAEVKKVVPALSEGGGYVFNNIHNFLAETEPEKIIEMYNVVNEL